MPRKPKSPNWFDEHMRHTQFLNSEIDAEIRRFQKLIATYRLLMQEKPIRPPAHFKEIRTGLAQVAENLFKLSYRIDDHNKQIAADIRDMQQGTGTGRTSRASEIRLASEPYLQKASEIRRKAQVVGEVLEQKMRDFRAGANASARTGYAPALLEIEKLKRPLEQAWKGIYDLANLQSKPRYEKNIVRLVSEVNQAADRAQELADKMIKTIRTGFGRAIRKREMFRIPYDMAIEINFKADAIRRRLVDMLESKVVEEKKQC